MTCGEVRVLMDAHIDGGLGPADEERLRAHLASCAGCAREVEERRAFSEALRAAFEGAVGEVESSPAERRGLVERMHAASRRRVFLPARLAAALMVGLAVGVAAYVAGSAGSRRLDPERREVAELVSEADARARQLEFLAREAADDIQKARKAAAAAPENPAVRLVSLRLSQLEELMAPEAAPARNLVDLVRATAGADVAVRGAAKKALRRLPPERVDELRRAAAAADCDRVYVGQVISELEERLRREAQPAIVVSQTDGGVTVEFRQHGSGRVELTVPGLKAEARSVADLLGSHAAVCRRFGIAGRDGAVVVGGREASVDLGRQISLMFRTGDWHEGLQWDAYRAWIAGRIRDAGEAERKVDDLRRRCAQAGRLPPVPEVKVDIRAVIDGVRKMTEAQLREAAERARERMKELHARLQEAREFRARARSLRVYAEGVAREE